MENDLKTDIYISLKGLIYMSVLLGISREHKCIPCDYIARDKYDYNKHTKTLKHFKKLNPNYKEEDIIYKCNICDKIYQHASSLNKHKKKCILIIIQEPQLISNADVPVLIELIQSQNEKIDLLTNEVQELKKNGINNTTNITNNNNNTTNNISLIVQLNTNCSNATLLEDFKNNIIIEEEQLKYLLDNGLDKGINNVIIYHLNLLPKIQRPLWCADRKRKKFLIKEINEWIEDFGRENLKKLCDSIAFECRKKYFELNPNIIPITNYTDKVKDKFIKNYKVLTNDISYDKIYDSIATNAVAIYSNNEK